MNSAPWNNFYICRTCGKAYNTIKAADGCCQETFDPDRKMTKTEKIEMTLTIDKIVRQYGLLFKRLVGE